MGAWPTVETGVQETGARPLDKAGFDGLASVLVSVACPSSGTHPNQHGEGKNRTVKDWWAKSWKADKGKFYPHPDSVRVEVNLKSRQAGEQVVGRGYRAAVSFHLCEQGQRWNHASSSLRTVNTFFGGDFRENMHFPRAT